MMRWISYDQELPWRWARKGHVPIQWRYMAARVCFPFEIAWLVRDESKRVLMPDGGWALSLDFYLNTPGHVIGLRDMKTADAHRWAIEWRSAMKSKIDEALNLARTL